MSPFTLPREKTWGDLAGHTIKLNNFISFLLDVIESAQLFYFCATNVGRDFMIRKIWL